MEDSFTVVVSVLLAAGVSRPTGGAHALAATTATVLATVDVGTRI